MTACHKKLNQTNYTHGRPRNPRCQGLVENANKTFKRKVKQKCITNGMTNRTGTEFPWYKHFLDVLEAENNKKIKMYGFTPFMALRNRDPKNPTLHKIEGVKRQAMMDSMQKAQHDIAAKKLSQAVTVAGAVVLPAGTHVHVQASQHAVDIHRVVSRWSTRATVYDYRSYHEGGELHYRVRWIDGGLDNAEPNTLSKRWYKASLLAPVAPGQEGEPCPPDRYTTPHEHFPLPGDRVDKLVDLMVLRRVSAFDRDNLESDLLDYVEDDEAYLVGSIIHREDDGRYYCLFPGDRTDTYLTRDQASEARDAYLTWNAPEGAAPHALFVAHHEPVDSDEHVFKPVDSDDSNQLRYSFLVCAFCSMFHCLYICAHY